LCTFFRKDSESQCPIYCVSLISLAPADAYVHLLSLAFLRWWILLIGWKEHKWTRWLPNEYLLDMKMYFEIIFLTKLNSKISGCWLILAFNVFNKRSKKLVICISIFIDLSTFRSFSVSSFQVFFKIYLMPHLTELSM
jgi:hypothetical protein